LGGLIADIKNDFIATVFLDLETTALPTIQRGYQMLEAAALSWLREEQRYDGPYRFIHSSDMRYQGQSYEIETILDATAIARGNLDGITEAFHRRHEEVYDHADREAAVQVINLRLVIVGQSPKPHFPRAAEIPAPATPSAHWRIYRDGAERDVPVFARAELRAGQYFAAPAVVTQSDCTSCIPRGFRGRVDAYGNLILTLAQAAGK
jgi:N-methylhydantoinase A